MIRAPLALRCLALVVLAVVAVTACAPVVMPAGAAYVAPELDGDRLIAFDGAALPVRSWLPASPPKAVVLALHGFNDYSNFFASPGAFLSARGIAAYAYDQRGFGGAPQRGFWPGTESLVADLQMASRLLRARHPSVPLFLLGESMGAAVIMVAMAGASPPQADGIILAAPAVWGRGSMPFYQTTALWIAAHTFPGGRLTGRGLGIRASDNDEMLIAQGRDPMVIKETRIDSVFGLVGLMDQAMAAAPGLSGRTLVLYGARDQLIPEAPIREMLATMPADSGRNRTVAYYDNGYHMLLRDLQAETVWRDIVAWITDPKAGLPSGADAAGRRIIVGFPQDSAKSAGPVAPQ
jgi:alpha-beta hydrolase superfamily lysophospholipase